MSDKPRELSDWDFPDTKLIPDGYDMISVPQATDDNFQKLVDEYNKLVRFVHSLSDSGE